MKQLLGILAVTLLFSSSAHSESWWEKGKALLTGDKDASPAEAIGELSIGDISAGLKDALKVGTGNVVGQLGAAGGFSADDAIRIALPEELQTAKKWLDKVGMADELIDLEGKMNEAAEIATPKAKALFWDSIASMSIDDARSIYNGSNDAATQYFREKMGGQLADLVRPVIGDSLNQAGAVKRFDDIMKEYQSIPFVPDVKANLTEHTVDKSLDGIFYYLAKEEAAIRANPAERTTELLKKVFSR